MLDPRDWAPLPRFDPLDGVVIRKPVAPGTGYWVGAPGAYFDPTDSRFYLVYRIRRPRGVEPDRGGEVRIARSDDGLHFDDIWSGTKDQLDSPSIERCALIRSDKGSWHLYVSYVDPADQRWRIDRVTAEAPDRFDLRTAERVLTAADIDAEGVKDPFVFRLAGEYQMIVSYATATGRYEHGDLHGTADAYNTGRIRSLTGLATSRDGIAWRWHGSILEPSSNGWDSYCSRIGCVWYQPPVWLALYDGSKDVSENYEEKCGLAYSHDLRSFHRVTTDGPWWMNPQASGALRYFDVLNCDDACYFYYEIAIADGSHELRGVRLPRG